MSRYMAFFPICPVCLEQQVYVMTDYVSGNDWMEMLECDCCGWQGDDPLDPDDFKPDEPDEKETA